MTVTVQMEVLIQIIKKHGLFYTQVFDIDSLNLIFEEESLTHQGAAATAARFVVQCLEKPNT